MRSAGLYREAVELIEAILVNKRVHRSQRSDPFKKRFLSSIRQICLSRLRVFYFIDFIFIVFIHLILIIIIIFIHSILTYICSVYINSSICINLTIY